MKLKITVAFLFAMINTGCNTQHSDQNQAPDSYTYFVANSATGMSTEDYPAVIEGHIDIEVRSQVYGYIADVLVDEGQFINPGQILFKIDPRPFDERIRKARANLAIAESKRDKAQLEVDQLIPLVKDKVVSEIELEGAKITLKSAEGAVQLSKAILDEARIDRGFTEVKAPIAGYIGKINNKKGSLVSHTDAVPLTYLSDNSTVHAYFSLSEGAYFDFRETYKDNNLPAVELVVSDDPSISFAGDVDMVNGQFEKSTGSIVLRASFPNPDGYLKSGNTGKINLTRTYPNVISIPQSATMEIQDKVFVFTVDKENRVKRKPIEIADSDNKHYLVSKGVEDGDKILNKGFENLKEGTLITPIESSENNNKQELM